MTKRKNPNSDDWRALSRAFDAVKIETVEPEQKKLSISMKVEILQIKGQQVEIMVSGAMLAEQQPRQKYWLFINESVTCEQVLSIEELVGAKIS